MGGLTAALRGVFGQTSAMRTVGVEEELLLVDVHTGKLRSVASHVVAAAAGDNAHGAGERGVEAELQPYMVETQSSMARELADVEEDLHKRRRVVASAALRPFFSAMPVHAI